MKALVIGGSGMVGRALISELERSGVEARGTAMSREGPGLARLDLQDREAALRLISVFKPDAIFNAVNTPGGVDYCEEHPEASEALHVLGARHLAEAALKTGARIVHYSTDYVFDGEAGPYSEEDPTHPVNVYGRSKLRAEREILERLPGSLVLRTASVYGWDRTSRNFAMQIWERLSAGRPMKAPLDQWCNPTLAEYLAETSVDLWRRGVEGVLNVVGRAYMTRPKMAVALAKAMSLDPSLIVPVATSSLGQKAPRPLKAGLKTDKLRRILRTEPLGMAESLERFRRKWRADVQAPR